MEYSVVYPKIFSRLDSDLDPGLNKGTTVNGILLMKKDQ